METSITTSTLSITMDRGKVRILDPLLAVCAVTESLPDSPNWKDIADRMRNVLRECGAVEIVGETAATPDSLTTTEAVMIFRAVQRWADDLGKDWSHSAE